MQFHTGRIGRRVYGAIPTGEMMNDPLYGQISYNSSPCNAFKLKLGYNVKLGCVEIKAATGNNIAEYVIRPAMVLPASLVKVRNTPLLIRMFGLQRYPMEMRKWWMIRQVGKRLTLVLM
jgi:hypothetical protein